MPFPPGNLHGPGTEPVSLNASCAGRQVLYLERRLGSPNIVLIVGNTVRLLYSFLTL